MICMGVMMVHHEVDLFSRSFIDLYAILLICFSGTSD